MKTEVQQAAVQHIRLESVVAAHNALMRIKTNELAAGVAFALALFLNEIEPLIQAYEAARVPLVRKHGRTSGVQVSVPAENMEAYVREFVEVLQPILQQEFALPKIKIRYSLLDSLKLSLEEATALLPFVDMEA
jgi:hypothetical protein